MAVTAIVAAADAFSATEAGLTESVIVFAVWPRTTRSGGGAAAPATTAAWEIATPSVDGTGSGAARTHSGASGSGAACSSHHGSCRGSAAPPASAPETTTPRPSPPARRSNFGSNGAP